MSPIRIGVSTKAYFGFRESVGWLEATIGASNASRAVREGRVEVFLAPSAPLIETAVRLAEGTPVVVCAQDCSPHTAGAHTGETTAELFAELGVRMVELGHAERRRDQGESDALIARKASRAIEAGLLPLLCVGESSRIPAVDAARVCAAQVDAVVSSGAAAVIAYEPVWAIGADRPADPEHVVAVATALRAHWGASTSRPILYGGSAGPGLLGALSPALDGLFLGRRAHDLQNFARVLDEADACA